MKHTFKNEEMRLCVELMALLKEKGKLGYAIAKNSRKLREEIPEYVDKRNELLQKYGTLTDPNKGQYTLTPENKELFEAELKEYSEIESEVDVYQIDEGTFFGGGLNNNQMEALMWMVKDENELTE